MYKKLIICSGLMFLVSCNTDNNGIKEENFLIFGYFIGKCVAGETCIETFMLTDKKLFEDAIDDYEGQNFQFFEL